MKKILLVIFSALAFAANAQNKPISVKPLPANEQQLEIDPAKDGKLYKAWQVIDKGGYMDFYLTMKSSGKFGSNGFTTALFGFAELNDHGGYLEKWTFKQYNQSPLQGIDLKNVKVEIKDMDNDGYAEYYICYYLYCDGLDADTWKMLVYNHGKKALKRFYVIKQDDDKDKKDEPAEGWNTLPKPVRDYADKMANAARSSAK
jgi:hypothetical protein